MCVRARELRPFICFDLCFISVALEFSFSPRHFNDFGGLCMASPSLAQSESISNFLRFSVELMN